MRLWRSVLNALDGWSTRGGLGVADEAEAFLEGCILERMCASGAGGHALPWMWLNAVAHADMAHVERLAGARPTRTMPTGTWRETRTVLARELLECSAGDPATMRLLQSRVLIPLEQCVAEGAEVTPTQLTYIGVHELRLATA